MAPVLHLHVPAHGHFGMLGDRQERSLASTLAGTGQNKLDEDSAHEYLSQITLALIEMDLQDLVHGEINPDNIVIAPDGRIKFADGVESSTKGSHATRNAFAGLPYTAPEALQFRGEIDIRTDIYSVGAVAYQLYSGHRPYDGNSKSEYARMLVLGQRKPASCYNTNVSPAMDAFLDHCLALHPDDRFQTPYEMLMAIEDLGPTAVQRPRAELLSPAGQSYAIPMTGGVLGRSVPSRRGDIAVDLGAEEHGRTVSREQAKIFCIRGQWIISPCPKTTNAMLLNGHLLEVGAQYELSDGDELEIGGVRLVLRLDQNTQSSMTVHKGRETDG